MRKNGFTLIELLVVISVLSLLMAILMPALARARQQGRAAVCLNNLRQMVIAAHVYAENCDGHYPIAYYTRVSSGLFCSYAWDFNTIKDWSTSPADVKVELGILWSGSGEKRIQQCPAFKGEHNWMDDPYTGYNYNTSYIGFDETQTPAQSAKVTKVKKPAFTALFGDGQWSEGANKFMRAPWPNPRDESFIGRYAGTQGYRHLGKTNVAFCDGHAGSQDKYYTETEPDGKEKLDKYNDVEKTKIGFLSPDNSVYDLE